MNLRGTVKGTAHVGIPTNDLCKTISFYENLGFDVILRTYNEAANEAVAFLKLSNYIIEAFETGHAAMCDGAYQHVALEVAGIDDLFAKLKEENYEMLHEEIQELPFWERGVRFFMILGPNNEKIEFCQKN